MGKYKFRLSDMVPNAWFYKLRDMSHSTRRSRNLQNFSTRSGGNSGLAARRSSFASLASSSPRMSLVPNRASYYYSSNSTNSTNLTSAVIDSRRSLSSTVNLARRIDADLPLETPRKSKRRHRRHVKVLINSPSRKSVSPSASIRCNCSGSGREKHENCVTEGCESFVSDSKKETVFADFITDTDTKRSNCKKLAGNRNASSNMIELALSPIRTRSADKECKDVDHSFYTDDKRPYLKTKSRSVSSKAVHPSRTLVVASPKSTTKTATKARKLINRSQKKSLAVIKYSSDPHRDFTESMIEMIIANDMRSSGDLEDLLACYLSLNSADYHSVIVKVFKQVWLDLNRLQFIE